MFNTDPERAKKLNNQRDEKIRVPDFIIDGLIEKFEEPNEEVLNSIDEIRYIYW